VLTCTDILVRDSDFRTLWLPGLAPQDLAEFTSAFEAVDLCCTPSPPELGLADAYQRLFALTCFAVNAYNALLLVAPRNLVPFRRLERARLIHDISIENTVVTSYGFIVRINHF
jgi:hypothetical protein